jgi:hypothetical protein
MKFWSKRSLGIPLTSLIAASAAAYEHPLHSSAIRNAYFLGSTNSESVNFLSKYKQTLTPQQTGPAHRRNGGANSFCSGCHKLPRTFR